MRRALFLALLVSTSAWAADRKPLVIVNGATKQLPAADNLKIDTLAGSGNRCVKASATGVLSPAAADCGTGSGTVTGVSVASANGFAGTVATSTTTPAITVSTSVTGLLKGNGTAVSAAVAGTDYLAPAAIGTTVQAYDADLSTYAGITPSANVQTLLGAANYSAFRSSLGLGTFATQDYASPPAIGGTAPAAGAFTTLSATGNLTTNVTGATQCLRVNSSGVVSGAGADCATGGSGDLLSTNNLSDVANAATARTNLGLAIGTNVQAYDADLDAIAALTGTNNIYYRSAANTWSPVSIGTNLSFAGGVLAATAGGGSGSITSSGYTQNTGKLLGRTTASSGAIEEVDPATWFTMTSTTLAPKFRGALVYKGSDQTSQNITTAAALTFDTEAYDTDSLHSTVSNTSRMSVPSGVSHVQPKACINIGTGTFGSGTDWVSLEFKKNGSPLTPVVSQLFVPGTGAPTVCLSGPPLAVSGGVDYLEVYARVASDTSITIAASTWFSLEILD